MPLFALIARMRLVASQAVVDEAERFVQLTVGLYHEPNLSLRQLNGYAARQDRVDPLKAFSEACPA